MKSGIAFCGLAAALLCGATLPSSAQPSPFAPSKPSASAVEKVVGYQCGPARHWSSKLGRCVKNKSGAGGGKKGM